MKTEMKKTLFMVAAVALAAAVSCNKEGLGDNGEGQAPSSIVFTAGVETKTTLVDNGDKTYDIHWVNGDAIVVDGVTFTTEDDGAKAFFYTESAFTADNDYYAIYPASAGTSFESITVPAVQTAKAGDFHAAAVVSVAKSATTSLDFKNVTSILKFQVPAPAETVTISSTSALAGEVSVDYNNGEPAWTAKNTVNEVTVNGPFETGKDYYVAVLPGEKADFEVRLDGYYSKSVTSVNPKRSKVMAMGTLPEKVVRFYVKNEYTHFDMNLYTWDASENKLSGAWPGTPMNYDKAKGAYYYNLPVSLVGTTINFIVNNTVDQTGDLTAKISGPEYNYDELNWKWLYFKPNSNWKQSGAWFAAYFWGSYGDKWKKMVGPDSNAIYGCVIVPNSTGMKFVRMNSADTNSLNWENDWNGTADLTIPTGDGNYYFKATDNWWDNDTGSWVKYELPTK